MNISRNCLDVSQVPVYAQGSGIALLGLRLRASTGSPAYFLIHHTQPKQREKAIYIPKIVIKSARVLRNGPQRMGAIHYYGSRYADTKASTYSRGIGNR